MKQITNIEDGTCFFTENKAIISLYENLPSDFIVVDAVVKNSLGLEKRLASFENRNFEYGNDDFEVYGKFTMHNGEHEIDDFQVQSGLHLIDMENLTPELRNMIREEIESDMHTSELFLDEWHNEMINDREDYIQQMKEDERGY
jgi:hypothetical protein